MYISIERRIRLVKWAHAYMASRKADFRIGSVEYPYLLRWWVLSRNPFFNIYLHRIYHDDDDRARHCHPWFNWSIILEGGYDEDTPDGIFVRNAGEVLFRTPWARHRLRLKKTPKGFGRVIRPATTIFITLFKMRTWGFHCPKGFVPWYDFVDANDKGSVGKGCGD